VFTGLVEELGRVVAREPHGDAARLVVAGPVVCTDLRVGDSVAVNGVCLTAVAVGDGTFSADAVAETLARSTLGALAAGDLVNLERPLTLAARLGGHLVQGHVDGTGLVLDRRSRDAGEEVDVTVPADLARFVVEKGSLTVDGVSLTVAGVSTDATEGLTVTLALIPATLAATTLGRRAVGEPVNLEVDVVAKYVAAQLAPLLGRGGAPGASAPTPEEDA
jgi:riboflavin synthase